MDLPFGPRSILSNVIIHNGLNLNLGLSLVSIVLPDLGPEQPRHWVLLLSASLIGAGLFAPLHSAAHSEVDR